MTAVWLHLCIIIIIIVIIVIIIIIIIISLSVFLFILFYFILFFSHLCGYVMLDKSTYVYTADDYRIQGSARSVADNSLFVQ